MILIIIYVTTYKKRTYFNASNRKFQSSINDVEIVGRTEHWYTINECCMDMTLGINKIFQSFRNKCAIIRA